MCLYQVSLNIKLNYELLIHIIDVDGIVNANFYSYLINNYFGLCEHAYMCTYCIYQDKWQKHGLGIIYTFA